MIRDSQLCPLLIQMITGSENRIYMPTDKEDDFLEYRVKNCQNNFEIHTASGRTILTFSDSNSASQYAALLNEAFKKGYKLGLRAGRKA